MKIISEDGLPEYGLNDTRSQGPHTSSYFALLCSTRTHHTSLNSYTHMQRSCEIRFDSQSWRFMFISSVLRLQRVSGSAVFRYVTVKGKLPIPSNQDDAVISRIMKMR